MPTPTATIFLPYHALDDVIQRGPRAAQPAASAVVPGTLYGVTDEGNRLERSDGLVWALYAPTDGGGGGGAPDPHATTHEPGGSDALTALNASTLTTGTLPDARLSGNVARRDQANTFTTTPQTISNTFPVFDFNNTSDPPDLRLMRIVNTGQAMRIYPVTDAGVPGPQAFAIDRAGILTVQGLDGTPLNASYLTTGTVPDARLSANVAREDVQNTFLQHQLLTYANPTVIWTDTLQPANSRVFAMANSGQFLVFAAQTDAYGHQTQPLALDRLGNVIVGVDLYEKGRATPMGHWTDIPFNAAHFSTPTAGATWTVTAANTWAYTLVGKTVILSLTILSTGTIAGAPLFLQVQLPPAIQVVSRPAQAVPFSFGIGTTVGTGICRFSGTQLDLIRDTLATAFPAGATYIYLTFPFSIT
jgi:hypothetical protein